MNDSIKKNHFGWEVWASVIIPGIIIIGLILAFIQVKPGESEYLQSPPVKYSNEMLLVGIFLIALLFPFLFAVYRKAFMRKKAMEPYDNNGSSTDQLIVEISIERFAIPISSLVTTILLLGGGLLYWDISKNRLYDKYLPGYGMSWLEIGNYIAFPIFILEWSLLGALIFILQDMLKRYITFDLTPRFYCLSTIRIILAISASFLVYAVIQAIEPFFELKFDTFGISLEKLNPSSKNQINIFWLIPICFTAGMFPVHFIRSITDSVKTWFLDILSNFPGSFGKIFQNKNYNIYLSRIVPREAVDRLREEAIYTVHDLATADTLNLARQTPYNMAKLIDWQDQAMFICTLGKVNTEKSISESNSVLEIFIQNGISRFSDLYYLYRLSADSKAFKKITQQVKEVPLLLYVLMQKGKEIDERVSDPNNKNIRSVAFDIWHQS